MTEDPFGPKTEPAPLPGLPPAAPPAPARTIPGSSPRPAGRLERGLLIVATLTAAALWPWAGAARLLFSAGPWGALRIVMAVELFATLPPLVFAALVLTLRGKPSGARLLLGSAFFGSLWAVVRAGVLGLTEPADILGLELLVATLGAIAVLGLRERRRRAFDVDAGAGHGDRASSAVAWVLPSLAASPLAIFALTADEDAPALLALLHHVPLVLLALSLLGPRRWRATLYAVAGLAAAASAFVIARDVRHGGALLWIALLVAVVVPPWAPFAVLLSDASRTGTLDARERRAVWAVPLRICAAISLFGAAYFLLVWGPGAAVDSAREQLDECQTLRGPPDSSAVKGCVARARAALRYPRWFPWTRGRVTDLEEREHRMHLVRALAWSARAAPNRPARDEAVRALCAESTTPVAAEVGAFALAASCVGRWAGDAFRTVAMSGDVDAMARIAALPGDEFHIGDTERAAALCLVGKRAEAAKVLTALSGNRDADSVAFACALGPGDVGFQPKGDAARALAFDAGARWGGMSAAEALRAGKLRGAAPVPMLAIVARALSEDELSAGDALAPAADSLVVDPMRWVAQCFLARGTTPLSLVGSTRYGSFAALPLAEVEAGAGKLEAMAAHRAARPTLRALRAEAFAMSLLAAGEHVRRGDAPGARPALERADRLAEPLAGLWSSTVHLAVGDGAGALAASEAFRDAVSRDDVIDRASAEMQRALALQMLGRRDEAGQAAAAAASSLSGYATSDRTEHAQVQMSAWLACATNLDAPFPSTVGLDRMNVLPLEKGYEDPARDRLAASSCHLALSPSAQREEARLRQPRIAIESEGAYAQAVLHVIEEVGAAAGDPEVWLDAAVEYPFTAGSVRAALLARAEAARWRGDRQAAEEWEQRFRRIAGLVHDARSAELADLAGL